MSNVSNVSNVSRWKKRFESLHKKFKKKKTLFTKHLEKLKKKGKDSAYKKTKALLENLEKDISQIKSVILQDSSDKTLKDRIIIFKKNFKKLCDLIKPAWRQWLEALLVAGIIAIFLRNFLFGLYHVPTGSAEPTILVGDRVWGNKLAYAFGKVKRGDLIIFDDPTHKYNKSSKLKYLWEKYIGLPVPLLGIKSGPINMTKRVIAIPGDWIEGRVEDGKTVIYLNNKKLEEPYVNKYPLIWLNKTVGFLPIESIGPIPIPRFLQKRPVSHGFWCTYDPEKDFDEQPFYNMNRSEVIQIPGYSSLREPYSPSERGVDSFGPMKVPDGKYWVMGDSRKNSKDSRWFGFLDEPLIHGRLSFIIYSVDSNEPLWLFELLKHPIDFWTKSIRWNRFFKKPI